MKAGTNKQNLMIGTLAVLIAGIAAYLTIRATSLYGVGISPDSTNYIRLARDITENGLAFLFEREAVVQPPVYPLVLAALSKLTGTTPLSSARWLNIAASAALAFTVTISIWRGAAFAPVVIVFGMLTCFSIPLSYVGSFAWTEPIFILTIYILFLIANVQKPTMKTALFASLLTVMACLTRYAGIVLIPVISAFIVLQWPGSLRRRLKCATTYAFVSSTLVILYIVRNYIVSGTALGRHAPSQMGLVANIDLATEKLIAWFLPYPIRSLGMLMLGLFILLAAVGWSQRERLTHVIQRLHPMAILNAAFAVAYIVFIVFTSTTSAFDHINSRLLSPVYPSLLIVMALFLNPSVLGGKVRSLLALSLICLLLTPTLMRTVVSDVNSRARTGAGGYNIRDWHESALMTHFRQNGAPANEVVFSNSYDALYILANVAANISPAKGYYSSNATTGVNAENLFERYPGLDGAMLVWFDRGHRTYLFTPDDLDKMCTLSVITAFEDGTIYRIESSNNRMQRDK